MGMEFFGVKDIGRKETIINFINVWLKTRSNKV